MYSKLSNIVLLSSNFVNSLPYSSNLPSCNDINNTDLIGHFQPDQTYLSNEELLEKDFASNLNEDGCYTPNDCVPEEKLLVVIPYRDRERHLRFWWGYGITG